MNLLKLGIEVYRKTLKRSKFMHIMVYKTMQHIVLPLVEKTRGFQTLSDDPLWFRTDLLTGSFEKDTANLVKQLVKPGMTVLDLGAHIGYYTKLFAILVGPRGRVIAFEPHPITFQALSKNVRQLSHVTPVQLAVGDKEGIATLYDFLENTGGSSLYYDKSIRKKYEAELNQEITPRKFLPLTTYTVHTTTVDSYLAKARINRVHFVKIDIEGAEINAIRGMRRTIHYSPEFFIVMEFYPRTLQSCGIDPLEALQELRQIGFSQIMIIKNNGELSELKGYMERELIGNLLERVTYVNLLCKKSA